MTLRTRVEYAEAVSALKTTHLRALMGGFVVAGFIVAACTGDDDAFRASPSQLYDASASDHFIPAPIAADATTEAFFCGDAAGAPQRALVVSGDTPSELAALNLDTGTVDGRYWLDGGSGVTSAGFNVDPWILDQKQDLVIRLDPKAPWQPLATWNVRSTDALPSAAQLSAMPVAVAEVSCTKAYVPRFGRNRIAIIDPSASGVAVPTGFIDLGPYMLAGDTGTIDMTSAVWVPSKQRVYVLVGNVDRTATAPDGSLGCTALTPSIFAIDPTTDALVSLGGKGLAGSIQLTGIDPPLGTAMLYDAAFERLLVVTGGCTVPGQDGGAGTTTRRQVEQIDLATGAVATLLDLTSWPRPKGIALADLQHAYAAFGTAAFEWDPSDGGILDAAAPALERVSDDGRGGFIGARRRTAIDGGAPVDLLAIPVADGGATVIGQGVFSTSVSNISSLEPWPHR